jgi:hypothetical protein
MTERLWKVLGADRQSLASGTKYQYPPKAWTKHLDPASLRLCYRGYHFAKGPQVLDWLREGLLCEIERCPKHEPLRGDNKICTCTLRIVRTFRLDARILRLFACDCAERALRMERRKGREPDPRSWEAVRVARLFTEGNATKKELAAACDAASSVGSACDAYADAAAADHAADAAAHAAACDADAAAAACDAAYAACDAARAADAYRAERRWQYGRFLKLVGA